MILVALGGTVLEVVDFGDDLAGEDRAGEDRAGELRGGVSRTGVLDFDLDLNFGLY